MDDKDDKNSETLVISSIICFYIRYHYINPNLEVCSMNTNVQDVQLAPKCPHENCGQVFNETNFRLAVYLNGVFFLVKPGKGIIGFTCPKCKKTITNSASYNDILKIKDHLANSFTEIVSCSENEEGETLLNPKSSFEPSLNYFSPFMLSSEVLNEFGIAYFDSNYMDNVSISDEILKYTNEERPELKDWYCSFVGDSNKPISMFRTVYWFDEKKISTCLQYENDYGIRIFPRYHYHTGLMENVNSLLKFNYFLGKPFDQTKADHEKENARVIEALKTYAYENDLNFEKLAQDNNINESSALINIIDQNQDRIAIDPSIPSDFLKVLTDAPSPLGNLLTDGVCDYLWAEIKPFEDRDLPESFIDEIDDTVLRLRTHEKLEKYSKMAKRALENANKQYVQDFLRENLVSFLEKYEKLILSNKFSYANVWQLKENCLIDLYGAVNKGLRDDMPYAMHREGEGWRIVFNGKPISGLRGKGFHWIYYIISNPNNKVYYRDLNELSVDKKKQKKATYIENELEGVLKADQLSVSDDSIFVNKNEIQKEELQTYKNLYKKLYLEKEQAVSKGNVTKVDRKMHDIKGVLQYLDENNIEYECKGPELKFKSKATTRTRDLTEAKKTTETEDFTGTKYKVINDKIKKNYRDAMKKIKTVDKNLHSYFSDHIKSEDGAFIYSPPEDIFWHLD